MNLKDLFEDYLKALGMTPHVDDVSITVTKREGILRASYDPAIRIYTLDWEPTSGQIDGKTYADMYKAIDEFRTAVAPLAKITVDNYKRFLRGQIGYTLGVKA